jgi:hypothetical protein
MATSTMGISISEMLNIISKVDSTPNTKIAEELGIPVTTLHSHVQQKQNS